MAGGNGPQVISWEDVNLKALLHDVPIAKLPVGNNGSRKKRDVLDICAAFDIETTRLPEIEQAFTYHWQFQIGDAPTIVGRELWQYRCLMDDLAEEVEKDQMLLIYVHNLSYEFHFLRAVYPDIKPEDVFSVRPRKPVKVKLYDGRIELRCSYILTNLSLDAWTRKMGVAHSKLSGFDYEKIRYPWTPLTPEELAYCVHDVKGLVEALSKQLEVYGDSLATIPLTSTGYVRRDVKRVMRQWSYKALQALQPSAPVYIALREAFRGGNTHANRYYTGEIIKDVGSMDRSSSYPDVLCNRPFPMGKLRKSYRLTVGWLNYLIKNNRAVLVRLRVTGLKLRDIYNPCPYISFSKIRGVKLKECLTDNGRILEAPVAEMTLTDLDYEIIKEGYKWDSIEILDMWDTRYAALPDILRALIIKYYTDKTELKGVKGQELYYDKSKALLNSIYGLQAQDPCKADTVYNPEPDDEHDIFIVEEGDIEAKLLKSRRQPYTGYQIGVWVCAWARWELQQAIDAAGDNFVYADTDSCKYCGELDFSAYNKAKVRASKGSGAYATDPKGTTHYMGVFESEGRYKEFVTMGAKKYAYIDADGETHITVAGVGKKAGAKELVKAGGLPAFKPGLIFTEAGGTEAIYNDRANLVLNVEGRELVIGPNVCLKPSTYKLGYAPEYYRLLGDIATLRRLEHEQNIKRALSEMEENDE